MHLTRTVAVMQLLELAVAEDLPQGDVTSEAIFGPHDTASARVLAKSDLVVCGLPLLPWILEHFDGPVTVRPHVNDGDFCHAGRIIAELSGSVLTLLGAERTCLNFLQHLSGIATFSRGLAERTAGSLRVVDTRKTLPGWRHLQKYAVAVGGCGNHRFNLSSGVLIKDNHIDACGSITEAVSRVRGAVPHGLKIEVEVRDEREADEAVNAGAEILLLDNMPPETIRLICTRHRGRASFEISGGVNGTNLDDYLGLGADLLSMGALTHSVKAVDISMKIQVNR
ncbi:carboxylating nicotinate-nucleotide diphosphorylase [Myxococcota bacterium]|nr:carboxylating nicotinate-nucleotide diphosphorylase [Myxococcota bacterium]